MPEISSLEQELNKRAQKCKFAAQMNRSYLLMKDHLETNYYGWIQANLPYFTDHGKHHIDSVIHTAGNLLGRTILKREETFSSLDIFLTLSAIIWHDAGMVFRRSGHQLLLTQLMAKIRELAFPDPSVFRLVNDIVKAHTGDQGLSIPDPDYTCTYAPKATYTVFPRSLASILRFADEVSENRTRISPAVLPHVPKGNQIFWQYAAAISSSVVDPARNRVVITFEPQASSLKQRYNCSEFATRRDAAGTISLLEYIVCRLEKVNNERVYCGRYLARYSDIRELVVRIAVFDGDTKVPGYDSLEFTVRDGGLTNDSYPLVPFFDNFFAANPTWNPAAVLGALDK